MEFFTPIPQAVLAFARPPSFSSEQELFVPAYASGISASILLLHFLLGLSSVTRLLERAGILSAERNKVPTPGIGRGPILHFRIARLLGCLGLLALTFTSSVHEKESARRHRLLSGALLAIPYVCLHLNFTGIHSKTFFASCMARSWHL